MKISRVCVQFEKIKMLDLWNKSFCDRKVWLVKIWQKGRMEEDIIEDEGNKMMLGLMLYLIFNEKK